MYQKHTHINVGLHFVEASSGLYPIMAQPSRVVVGSLRQLQNGSGTATGCRFVHNSNHFINMTITITVSWARTRGSCSAGRSVLSLDMTSICSGRIMAGSMTGSTWTSRIIHLLHALSSSISSRPGRFCRIQIEPTRF